MRVAGWVRSLCAGMLIAAAASGSARAQRTGDLRAEAVRLYGAGRYPEAIPFFDEVLRRKPRDIEAFNLRGGAYLRLNQPEAALADFDAVIRINPALGGIPADPEAWTNRGISLVMLGRDGEALLAFQRAIALHGFFFNRNRAGLAADYCGIGQVYHKKGDDSRALDAFDRAIRIDPDDPNGFVGRGLALVGLGMTDQGVSAYDQALRLSPNHARAYGYRAVALERLGRDEEALKDYDATIRLDPNVATTLRLRGSLLSRLGRQDDALADFTAAIRLTPQDSGPYKDRGGVYNRLGDYPKALADLDEAIRLDPAAAKAYQNRAATYNGLGRHELALRDCERALALDPKSAGALNNRGVARLAKDQLEAAITDFTDALRIDSAFVAAFVNRADAYMKLGRIEAAASDYEEVARLDPKLAIALPGLAQLHEIQKRRPRSTPDDALSIHDALTQAAAEFDRANARRADGDWSGAISGYTQALQSDPNHADALSLRGWSRLCTGEPGADVDARRALDLKGWRDPLAPYLALLGHLAARRERRDRDADGFLDEALANTRPPAWPAPVFRYLKRTLTSERLFEAASDSNKMTEARTVVGLDLLYRGERTAAEEHLRWVVDHGADASIAKDVARETLRRLNESQRSSAPAGP